MEILRSLGVDSTLFIQLACFLVSYLAISQLVLKPYMRALHERENRTVGSEESSVRLIEEANELHAAYEKKARSIHTEIKAYYDQSRTAAMKESEQVISASRELAATELEKARALIAAEIQRARQTLSSEIPSVSAAIASKFAGKEITV